MNNNILMVKVCKLYYQRSLSKIEIGEKLRISRLKVAKLLSQAQQEGIVEIYIKEPQNSFLDLENALEEKFKIYRAVVTETSFDYEETKGNIGKAAASCFLSMVDDNDVIGISWGTTIYEMVNSMPSSVDKKNISVVQLTGGLNQVSTSVNSIELTGRLARVFNANSYQLYAPEIVDSEETKKALLSDSSIKKTIEMFTKVNIAIVGIGTIFSEISSTVYRDRLIKKDEFEYILKCNAVGDINTHFYDYEGKQCHTVLENRIIGMDIDQLKRIRYVMGVAGGKLKANAIYSALKGKIVNIIVTDYEVAKDLIERD